MEHVALMLLFLLVSVAALPWLSRALDVRYPILLVLGGSVPGVPDAELDPDVVLLIVLPPLLFHTAYFASLRELRTHARAFRSTPSGSCSRRCSRSR